MTPDEDVKTLATLIALRYLQKYVVLALQLFLYPLVILLRFVFIRNQLTSDAAALDWRGTPAGTGCVIYANHQSKLDGLIICAALPIRTMIQLLPLRFFVHNPYLKGPGGALLTALGGFPAHIEPDRPYGLDQARLLLGSGQSIMIFPSGMRTRERVAKRGISVLAAEPTVRLIPIHLDWTDRWHCSVTIGEPMDEATHTADKLMDRVYELTKSGAGHADTVADSGQAA
jgi:1-acyl-sn-glycerol-3-phosphate acyltransferase